MKNIAIASESDRRVLFTRTAEKKNLHPMIVEKDYWVCFMLNHLFHDCKYKDAWVFKGGTSLSKAYHVIERFSEDIDLILDWRGISIAGENPWDERSKTKQDKFNKQINYNAAKFYAEELLSVLNCELCEVLGAGEWFSIDPNDGMVINFNYPQLFETIYVRPIVRLEIGPLAEWVPSHSEEVVPFVAEEYPDLFEMPCTKIRTIDVERSFWEKITILHKIAHFSEGKMLPHRYSRHLYDVYCMGTSKVKESAFARKELLEMDVTFKQKFYYSKSAHYDTATIKDVCLVPKGVILDELREDYKAMENMIYGRVPEFDDIIDFLKLLQDEIHSLSRE